MINAPDNWAITHYNHGQTPAAARRERIAVAMLSSMASNADLTSKFTRSEMVLEALMATDALIAELDGEGKQ